MTCSGISVGHTYAKAICGRPKISQQSTWELPRDITFFQNKTYMYNGTYCKSSNFSPPKALPYVECMHTFVMKMTIKMFFSG